MTTPHLSIEQIRFIAANAAPRFGPMIDNPLSHRTTQAETMAEVSRVIVQDDALQVAIVAEAYLETTADTHPTMIALKALGVVAATMAAHDHSLIVGTVMGELMPHSALLQGAINHGE